ncbi:leucyl-tRNA synthetase [Lachnoanaerobaculum gingivalis]|uniref:leucyl-tRNA synthetase n=1 Tax=Lachnoanaerobaculum gingivalis TaxID=2490855 RepID=UPI0028D72E0E|nr:leucyl-tRNA synthetase [Lachnoanaerobaculum gingivalis]
MKDTVSIAKKRWENRALVFGIVSIVLNMCAMPISGVPLGIPMGIFAVAFGIISAVGGIRGRAVAGIITGIFGILIGLIIYLMILFVITQLKDPNVLSMFKPEQINVLQDYIQFYIAH